MAGDLGINEKLIDNDYPMFYIHKTNWKKMITAKENGNEELLSQLIGENIDSKRIREMSKEPVRQQVHAIKISKICHSGVFQSLPIGIVDTHLVVT